MAFTAKILADSLAPSGVRLTTFELTYPRCIHSEIMTHRMLSKNAASSRAIPTEKLIQRVVDDPFVPIHWGKNQKGMQADQELTAGEQDAASVTWILARDSAVSSARRLLELGLHKQIVNRVIEPWMWITIIVSSTTWSNFFGLRCHKDAEPHFQKIAGMARALFESSTPRELRLGEWHMPLVYIEDQDLASQVLGYADCGAAKDALSPSEARRQVGEVLRKVSVGRCARVSYLTHDGRRDLAEDIALHDRLKDANPGHWCYDAETEVLTSRGWRRWPDIIVGDYLAGVDVISREIRFSPVTSYRLKVAPFSGEMYAVRGQQVDLLVTPNHRMVVASRQNDGSWTQFDFTEATILGRSPVRYLKAGFLDPGARRAWQNPWGIDPTTWARFIGFFVGDGNAEGGNQARFNVRLERKEDYVRAVGLPWRKVVKGFVMELPGLGNWLRENCYTTSGEKRFPDQYLLLTYAEILALFDGLRNSDGSTKRRTWMYSTTSVPVRDALQALLHLNGLTGSVSVTERVTPQHSCYRINVSRRVEPRVEVNQHGRSLSYEIGSVPYEGLVYCATVNEGALLVRRNGRVVVSGNSPFEHVARAESDPKLRSGNFQGWTQYRKLFEQEHIGGRMP